MREVTRQRMGFTPQDRTFAHHGPREVVTLDLILHNPLCLPIRDRDKHNKRISDKHTLMRACETARRSMVFTPHIRAGLGWGSTTLLPTPFSFR